MILIRVEGGKTFIVQVSAVHRSVPMLNVKTFLTANCANIPVFTCSTRTWLCEHTSVLTYFPRKYNNYGSKICNLNANNHESREA